jgi:hypothetical protein
MAWLVGKQVPSDLGTQFQCNGRARKRLTSAKSDELGPDLLDGRLVSGHGWQVYDM